MKYCVFNLDSWCGYRNRILSWLAVAAKVLLQDLWSIYFIFSGRQGNGNGGKNKSSKDPKCAASNEARAVGAVGVVDPTHLEKTKIMS